jgi:single-stranded-DNA-specific exonuclease
VQLAGPPRRVGKTGDHLQLFIRQGSTQMKCIAFGRGDLFDQLQSGTTLNLAVEPQLNEWNGRVSVELDVKDLQIV